MARREMGKLVFLDLVDRSGRIQLLCDDESDGRASTSTSATSSASSGRRRSRGAASRRSQSTSSRCSRGTGARCRTRSTALTDVETRYRKRYLDLLMNEDSRELFLLRARVVTAIRRLPRRGGLRRGRDPVLQPRYGGAFAHPFVTHSNELDADLYLRIATELYLKRLIVGGLERVYEIGKDFRNEGVSYKHQPEFTMLEWYEAYADYRDTMARIEALVERVALEVLGTTDVTLPGARDRPEGAVARACASSTRSRQLELWTRDAGELRAWLEERGVDTDADKDWPQLVDHAFSHFVEPSLIAADDRPRLPGRALAVRARDGRRPALTERFEYFAGGMELGNAFTEINDAEEQQRALRRAVGARRGRARRPGLRRGALVRDAADGRPRPRDRPARDAPRRAARRSAT